MCTVICFLISTTEIGEIMNFDVLKQMRIFFELNAKSWF